MHALCQENASSSRLNVDARKTRLEQLFRFFDIAHTGKALILMLVLVLVLVLVLTLKLTLMAVLNTPDLALSLRPHANLVIAVNHMLQTNPNQDDNCVVQACSTW